MSANRESIEAVVRDGRHPAKDRRRLDYLSLRCHPRRYYVARRLISIGNLSRRSSYEFDAGRRSVLISSNIIEELNMAKAEYAAKRDPNR
jgi:hypothetical protein